MCYNYRQPALLIFIFITFISSGVLITHINYYLSYGPMTLGQENGYYLSFGGNALIIFVSLSSTMILSAPDQKSYLPILFNLGFGLASSFILAAAVLFFEDPPSTPSMQAYVLHKFIESNKNTPLMERLQTHQDNELGALNCCGVKSFMDYTAVNHDHDTSHLNITHIHVPDTCCIIVSPGCGKELDYPRPQPEDDHQIFQKGCLEGGIENFMKRLDYLTYGLYHYIAFTVIVVLICCLFSMASFNILFYCSEGEEVHLESFFYRNNNNKTEGKTGASTKDIASTDTIGAPSITLLNGEADGVLSGTSTGNMAATTNHH